MSILRTARATRSDSTDPPPCLVREITSGDQCALWFKNNDYVWSSVQMGKPVRRIGSFVQVVTGLLPGSYIAAWYDPQKGVFAATTVPVLTTEDGT